MYVNHVTLSGILTVTEDLHIGSGEEKEIGGRRVATLFRNDRKIPVIPSTSLKGAVRSAGQYDSRDDAAFVRDVFGTTDASRDDRSGAMGRLWFHTAALCPDSRELAKTQGLPGADRNSTDSDRPGSFIRVRTAIDRQSGGPDEHKLFAAEWIPQQAGFRFSVLWHSTGATTEGFSGVDQPTLARALAPLAVPGGCPLGKAGGRSGGRVELDLATLKITLHHLDPTTGEITETLLDKAAHAGFVRAIRAAALSLQQRTVRRITLRLTGQSPFLSINADAPRRGDSDNTLASVRRGNDPALWGSSLLGALRDRAAWLAECFRARADGPPGIVPADRDATAPADDRFLSRSSVGSVAEAQALSSVERLFGVPGWRGRIGIESLTCVDPGAETVIFPGVSIDRFTGGHRDGFLFNTEAVINPAFAVTLTVDARHLTAADNALITALLADLEDTSAEPLFLGHGASKGLGWFAVAVTADDGADSTATAGHPEDTTQHSLETEGA